jgi:hypothetical protein
MAVDNTSTELRKLAAILREEDSKLDKQTAHSTLVKVGHILCAGKGLSILGQKVRGWYEPSI